MCTEQPHASTPVVLVTGIDYPGHKWQQTAPVLAHLLRADSRLDVTLVRDPAFLGSEQLHQYRTLVLHMANWEAPDPPEQTLQNLQRFVSSGGGLVVVHFASGAFKGWPDYAQIAGRTWAEGRSGHDPRGVFTVKPADTEHQITRGLHPFETDDELYTNLGGDAPITVLATAASTVDGKRHPIAFVLNHAGGRVFHCPLGHDVKAFDAPMVGELFRRGTAWTAGLAATV